MEIHTHRGSISQLLQHKLPSTQWKAIQALRQKESCKPYLHLFRHHSTERDTTTNSALPSSTAHSKEQQASHDSTEVNYNGLSPNESPEIRDRLASGQHASTSSAVDDEIETSLVRIASPLPSDTDYVVCSMHHTYGSCKNCGS